MSALTKIAVVLLVIASLLLSAGVVVFVNKDEHFRKAAEIADDQYKREFASHKDARAQLESVNAQLLAVSVDLNKRIGQLKTESEVKDNEKLKADNQAEALKQDLKVKDLALANMTKVQEGQQTQLASALGQITELRGIRDKLVDERHSLNTQLTDALARVDALDRARKGLEEQKAGLRASMDDLESKMRAAGFQRDTLPKRSNEGTPVLEGVVSSVFPAGGKPWASITIGSKDNVVKGMKFNVVNNNEFLGYLTIQTTEPNEATGVLDGPGADKVHTGDQVKTQLQ